MMPTRVALFPYDDQVAQTRGFLDDLMLVASALQTQVTRDVGPIWGVSAVVSAFSSLNMVPPGYAPFGIQSANLALNRADFHYSADGQPAALIQYCGDWSVAASHELIELLCDPTGTKTVTAPSVGDQKLAVETPANVVAGVRTYREQGLVEYVMEVCDPVEQSTYQIGMVNVSDFVTPDFYASEPGQPYTRYSFKGDVNGPLQLLPGGYISWATQIGPKRQSSEVYQAFAPGNGDKPVDPGDLTIKKIGKTPKVLSRAWMDAKADDDRKRRASEACTAPKHYVDTSSAASEYTAGVGRQIDRVHKASGAPDNLDTILKLVRALARDDGFRTSFTDNPREALDSIGLTDVPAPDKPIELRPKDTYQRLQGSLERSHRVGYTFNEQPFEPWLQHLLKFPG
jgi:hypothetical protein